MKEFAENLHTILNLIQTNSKQFLASAFGVASSAWVAIDPALISKLSGLLAIAVTALVLVNENKKSKSIDIQNKIDEIKLEQAIREAEHKRRKEDAENAQLNI